MNKYFFAYGTNISPTELRKTFPEAKLAGYGYLNDYALKFVGYDGNAIVTVYKKKGSKVPVSVWEFPEELQLTITNHEKFPYLYKRQKVKTVVGDKKLRGEIYLPKQNLKYGRPNEDYLNALRKAYVEAGFPGELIDFALQNNKEDE